MMTNNTSSDLDVLFSPSPAYRMITNLASTSIPDVNYQHSARKKRSKLIKADASRTSSSCSGGVVSKPKYAKKPDPAAPKITKPCSECGKKFWSWKALFGHMRCHPERQWRGINPPSNFQRPEVSAVEEAITSVEKGMTMEDHEIAACLLMLANGDGGVGTSSRGVEDDNGLNLGGGVSCRFECNSCKKVFGSHQALGGHRASHKNVKGCFAITQSSDGGCEIIYQEHRCSDYSWEDGDERKMVMVLGHECSVCLRLFSSGQALGGHKRGHWERGDEPLLLSQGLNSLDLNLPASSADDGSGCSSYSTGLALDLRLGL